jgi:hypothetical protein
MFFNHILLVHNNDTIFTYWRVKMFMRAFILFQPESAKIAETFSTFRLKFTQGFLLKFLF